LKTDARVRYTKSIIEKSFFTLLKMKPLNKISVKSVCDLAEINRTTFYRYYTDPYDLLRQIENNLVQSMESLIQDAKAGNIDKTILSVVDAIHEHSDIYTLLVSDYGDRNFINRIINESYVILKDKIKTYLPETSETDRKWLYNFLTHGSINIIFLWIEDGMKEEQKDVAKFIKKLIEQSINKFR